MKDLSLFAFGVGCLLVVAGWVGWASGRNGACRDQCTALEHTSGIYRDVGCVCIDEVTP